MGAATSEANRRQVQRTRPEKLSARQSKNAYLYVYHLLSFATKVLLKVTEQLEGSSCSLLPVRGDPGSNKEGRKNENGNLAKGNTQDVKRKG